MRVHAAYKGSALHQLMDVLGTPRAQLDITHPETREMIRRLDVEKFTALLAEIGGDQPSSRHAVLAMMHKVRAQWRFRHVWGDGAARISKRWLKAHGFTTMLNDERMEQVQAKD